MTRFEITAASHFPFTAFILISIATLMAVAIKPGGPTLEANAPTPLFKAPIVAATLAIRRDYDVADDGRFLINVTSPAGSAAPFGGTPITVVLNWSAALRN